MADRPALTDRELQALRADLRLPGRGRITIEGRTIPRVDWPDGLRAVDLVDCLIGFTFYRGRIQRWMAPSELAIVDCSFTRCDWPRPFFVGGAIRESRFERVRITDGVFSRSEIEESAFLGVRLDDFSMKGVTLRRVTIRDVDIRPRAHWKDCTFDDVTISGQAQTLVVSGPTIRRLDVAELRMRDSVIEVGDLAAAIRFPAFDECFVVPSEALDLVDAELVASELRPATIALFREMASSIGTGTRFSVVDPSLFEADLVDPRQRTTAAELDRIMDALRRHRVAATPSWKGGGP